uniref:EAL domain-containing protein n=1 Tax=Acrobeloides nanus TaxID=290746 RepID=A0A914E3T9_9BILA
MISINNTGEEEQLIDIIKDPLNQTEFIRQVLNYTNQNNLNGVVLDRNCSEERENLEKESFKNFVENLKEHGLDIVLTTTGCSSPDIQDLMRYTNSYFDLS